MAGRGDCGFAKEVGSDVLCAGVQVPDGRDEGGLDDVVPPGPSAEPVAALATAVMETPRVDMSAAGTQQLTVTELAERNAEPELQGAPEVRGQCSKPPVGGEG